MIAPLWLPCTFASQFPSGVIMALKPVVGNAIVTGASSGIGRASAVALGRAGWNVTIAGRKKPELEETARLAKAEDPQTNNRVVIFVGDLTDHANIDPLFTTHTDAFGRLDVIFNNAGVAQKKYEFDETPKEVWDSVMNINLTVPYLCSQKAFGVMRNQSPQGGRIINNGSVSAYSPREGAVSYTVAKHAITGLTKQLALDGRPLNIACSQLDIGNASSAMTSGGKGSVTFNSAEPTFNIEHTGQAILYMASLPLDVNVLNQTLMASGMPFVGRG